MQTSLEDSSFSRALHTHGFRATKGRMALLALLNQAGKPLSIPNILAEWDHAPNEATLYRTLGDLSAAGIVRRLDLGHNRAYFEYTPGHPHHHHVVCTNCGVIEDIDICLGPDINERVGRKAHTFNRISSHDLEFFGLCNHCAA